MHSQLDAQSRDVLLRESSQGVRVHRSIIVNVDHVREIVREGQSEGSIILMNGQRLKLSKAGWQNLLAICRT
jgi:two-component system, LytTR family, response regulator